VLVHALPGCRLELAGADGEVVVVGFGAQCDLSPCDLRAALIHGCARCGLPPRVDGLQLIDHPPAVRHVGLGLYRYLDGACFGYAGATLLRPDLVAEVLQTTLRDGDEGELPGAGEYHFVADEELGVTLVYTRHDAAPLPSTIVAAERYAQRGFVACLAAELADGPL
jgi:hypothetical protein